MLASIPIRYEPFRRQQPMVVQTHYLFASDQVPEPRRAPKDLTRLRPEKRLWYPDVCHESVLLDPFGRQGVFIHPQSITHFDYLNLVTGVLQYWMSTQARISTPWLNEIIRIEGALRTQREKEMQSPSHRTLDYAGDIWDFVTPQYDPDAMSMWDPVQNIWVTA